MVRGRCIPHWLSVDEIFEETKVDPWFPVQIEDHRSIWTEADQGTQAGIADRWRAVI